MPTKVKKWMTVLSGLAIMGLLSACATPSASSVDPSSQTSASEPSLVERIRYSELSAWSLLKEGGLWIELNNPIRTYRLTLQPSCELALQQALTIRFVGASPSFIALGDRVVVGRSQCQITGIYETDQQRGARLSVGKGLE